MDRGSTTRPEPHGISIVIASENLREALDACLHALELQHDLRFELVVVDAGSKDGSQQLVTSRYPRALLVDVGEPIGLGAAFNRGIAVTSQPWVLTLSADAVADAGLVEALRRQAGAAAERVGMIQCRVLSKQRPERTRSTGIVLLGGGVAGDRDADAPARRDDRVEEIFCARAGGALYRRAMLVELSLGEGPFDPSFSRGWEDVDLGWRARLSGWAALYAPDAIVQRAAEATPPAPHADRDARRSRLRALLKNGSPALVARSLPSGAIDVVRLVAGSGAAGALELVRELKGALGARAEVDRARRVERRALERQWIAKAPARRP